MGTSVESKTEFRQLCDAISGGSRVINLSGLISVPSKAYIISKLQAETHKTLVVVAPTNEELETWRRDLDFFVVHDQGRTAGEGFSRNIASFPAFEADIYSGASPHAETQEERAIALWQLTKEDPEFVLVSAKSLISRIPVKEDFKGLGAVIRRDEDHAPENLISKLAAGGYRREEPIANFGEFSTRGGILDVWSPDSESPVRIEFFGDTVDSIRSFDPITQLSIEQLESVSICPMREFSVTPEKMKDWAEKASERFDDVAFARNLKDRTDFAKEGETFSGWEFLTRLTDVSSGSITDYVKDAVFVIDEPTVVESTLEDFYRYIESHYLEIVEHGEIGLRPEELFIEGSELREKLDTAQRIELRGLGRLAAEADEEFAIEGKIAGIELAQDFAANQKLKTTIEDPLFLFPTSEKSSDFEIRSRSVLNYQGDIKKFAGDFSKRNSKNSGSEPLFILQSQGLAERFNDILRDYDVILPDKLLQLGELSSGFEIPGLGIEIYTEREIFGENTQRAFRPLRPKPTKRRAKTGAFISDFRDLKQGDFVVHVDHGIGRFEGLEMIGTQGVEREFMLLVYADDAKLFVPVERLDLVSRYGSSEGVQPNLDRLGSMGWHKTKARAKRAMRDMADELLRLYAERKLVQGFAFSKDAPWQKEFEGSFPYRLTSDQATSIEEIKRDMETAVPMDRLVVGDVGYGKTEVAMRAAFKAVMDGKQVAVLTPTTVLSYQHFETFKQRFSAFPISIEMISRFRSRKEQKEIVSRMEKGEIDVLIGTHRLLSNDVKFPKLGLLVVDEEQRFGVAHKEKLKQLRKKVDVLTLTATPIPRTLNMSMVGMRDMSIIETPPRDRLAINTQVVQFSEGIIKSAIDLELARNGQVFFIHNRVQTIDAIAAHIQKIVPNARIVVGHGQMGEKELESVMLDFVDYKYDVLVATTIIENGIDIPRANTMIINRADNYGLSQLYQLRGRVGRSSRRAYAYLLIPPEQELTPIARRRLSAIREFSDLGAGFRIAALDLELRGAGNLLGGQQSGHMESLGFDLYTKMLNRTIQELRGEEIEDETSVSLNLGVDVSIPNDYINETSQRLRTYKRISSAETEEDLRAIYIEIQDRYGKLPESVEELFRYARLRQTAESMHVISVDRASGGVAIKMGEKSFVSPEKLMQFVESNEGSTFSPNGILRVSIDSNDLIDAARGVLEEIAE